MWPHFHMTICQLSEVYCSLRVQKYLYLMTIVTPSYPHFHIFWVQYKCRICDSISLSIISSCFFQGTNLWWIPLLLTAYIAMRTNLWNVFSQSAFTSGKLSHDRYSQYLSRAVFASVVNYFEPSIYQKNALLVSIFISASNLHKVLDCGIGI